MLRPIRTLSTLAVTFLIMTFASSVQAQILEVEIEGETYLLSTQFTSYDGNPSLLESQPWWGDAELAAAIAGEMQYQLGDLFGGPATQPGIPSALLAYGTEPVIEGPEGEFVSIAYWVDSVIDCPSGCPLSGDSFAYVVVYRAEGVPVNSNWTLLLMALLLGGLAMRRLHRHPF